MSLNPVSEKRYLKIVDGRVREKVSPETPGAILRETDKGNVYEFVYESVGGVLTSVYLDEDRKFGNSWKLTLIEKNQDATQTYIIQIQEESKYGEDFAKKLPQLHNGMKISLKPYSFQDKKDGRKITGITITDLESGEKMQSAYHEFDTEANKWVPKDGFPVYDGPADDKDEWKVYKITVRKYLRSHALLFLDTEFGKPVESKDGLPF